MAANKITMPRGDLRKIKFQITDSTGQQFSSPTEIYFTVKDNAKSKSVKFQKRLSKGDITLGQDGYYHFIIQPEDTDNLTYQEYVFDIEVVGQELKQTSIGKLVITEEVTFHSDEGTDEESGGTDG